jgi:hypothetical protein
LSLVREYESDDVAFVEGYDKTVGFTFHSGYLGNLSLKIENVHQAKDVYDFFGNLFRDHTDEESGMSKSLSRLYGDWDIAKAKIEEVLLRIEKAMGSDWKDAFRTIISVYEK